MDKKMNSDFDLRFRNLKMEITDYHLDDDGVPTEHARIVSFFKENMEDPDCAISLDREGNLTAYVSIRDFDGVMIFDKYFFDKEGKLEKRAYFSPYGEEPEEVYVCDIASQEFRKMAEITVFALTCEAKDRLNIPYSQ